VIWAAVGLIVMSAATAAWAWYFSSRLLAATSETQRRRLLRRAAWGDAAITVAILIIGVVAFAVTGYNWLVLAATWSYPLLHIGLRVRTRRMAHKRTDQTSLPR
jgi:hypothetical protein